MLQITTSTTAADPGLVTLDLGFANTASCQSRITFVDGERGILRYQGIPVEQLAEHSTFVETAYLLINGDLPPPKSPVELSPGRLRHESLQIGGQIHVLIGYPELPPDMLPVPVHSDG